MKQAAHSCNGAKSIVLRVESFFVFKKDFFAGKQTVKYIYEYTQEMPQSRSTAFQKHQRN